MTTKTAPRITRQIDARTALRTVENKGSVTLLGDDGTATTYVAAEMPRETMFSVVRLTTAEGDTRDLTWDYRDEKNLTEVVPMPQVGDGVTMGVGSDSYGGTIWSVSPSGKTFTFTIDDRRWEGQEQVYTPREPWTRTEHGFTETNVETARWSAKRGRYTVGPYSTVSVGTKRTHLDPHF